MATLFKKLGSVHKIDMFVVRCCNTIMMLLKMADEKDTPGADALMPVLTYVLIKVS